jgi:aspartate kinase
MERALVHDVALEFGIEKISVTGPADGQARVFRALADAGVPTDMVFQRVLDASGLMELSFTVARAQAGRALAALRGSGPHPGGSSVRRDAPVAKISLLGTGLRCDARVCASFYEVVSRAGGAFGLASPSATGICAVVRETDAVRCARAVRAHFGLLPEDAAVRADHGLVTSAA